MGGSHHSQLFACNRATEHAGYQATVVCSAQPDAAASTHAQSHLLQDSKPPLPVFKSNGVDLQQLLSHFEEQTMSLRLLQTLPFVCIFFVHPQESHKLLHG